MKRGEGEREKEREKKEKEREKKEKERERKRKKERWFEKKVCVFVCMQPGEKGGENDVHRNKEEKEE